MSNELILAILKTLNQQVAQNAMNIDQTAALLFRILHHLGTSVEDALPLMELTAPIEGFEEWVDELRNRALALMEEDGKFNPKDFKDFLETLDSDEES